MHGNYDTPLGIAMATFGCSPQKVRVDEFKGYWHGPKAR
jgi:hypothetical protein